MLRDCLSPELSGLIPLLYHTAYLTLLQHLKAEMMFITVQTFAFFFSKTSRAVLFSLSPVTLLLVCILMRSLSSQGSYSSSSSSFSFCYLFL